MKKTIAPLNPLALCLMLVTLTLNFGIGCSKEKKSSAEELQEREFMVGPKTLKMLQVPRLTAMSCSGCAAFEGRGYTIDINDPLEQDNPESLEQATEKYNQELGMEASELTKKKLENGIIISGPEMVMSWIKVDKYSPIRCRIRLRGKGSKEEQALMEKMCLSIYNPYAKKK